MTGGTGFIGSRLCARLAAPVRLLSRSAQGASFAVDFACVNINSLLPVCEGVNTVYHCAGYAHAWQSRDPKIATRHWQINFEGTRKLVEAAGQSGVRRFVFLSSVKAMGDPGAQCINEEWPVAPTTPYGQAKRAAEEAVLEAGAKYGMHVVNLRLAMVYGRGGRGNLERMAQMIDRGWFPPLPETKNKRSLVHVEDVVSAMICVAERSEALGKTYIISDPVAYSGRQLYDNIRKAKGLKPSAASLPTGSLRLAARCGDVWEGVVKRRAIFNSEAFNKLLGWECYSSHRIYQELGWRTQVSLEQGLLELFGAWIFKRPH